MSRDTKIQLVIDIINGALHDSSKPWAAAFGRAESMTGLPRFKVLLCFILLTSVLLVCGPSAAVVSNLIGLVYPTMATISLSVSPPEWRKYERVSAAVEAQNERFTYWMTFAVILIGESYCGPVLRMVPMYQWARTLFLIWCFAPIHDNGSAYIYDQVVRKSFRLML